MAVDEHGSQTDSFQLFIASERTTSYDPSLQWDYPLNDGQGWVYNTDSMIDGAMIHDTHPMVPIVDTRIDPTTGEWPIIHQVPYTLDGSDLVLIVPLSYLTDRSPKGLFYYVTFSGNATIVGQSAVGVPEPATIAIAVVFLLLTGPMYIARRRAGSVP
jgi:hypothetical protein